MTELELLSKDEIPTILAELAEEGYADYVRLVGDVWADDGKGGRSSQKLDKTSSLIPVVITDKKSNPQTDEGQRDKSYTFYDVIFPYAVGGIEINVKLRDVLVREPRFGKPPAELIIEGIVPIEAYIKLLVKQDMKKDLRVQGA